MSQLRSPERKLSYNDITLKGPQQKLECIMKPHHWWHQSLQPLLDCIIKVFITIEPQRWQRGEEFHTRPSATALGNRPLLLLVFFWNPWHHCLGAPSLNFLVTLATYQTSRGNSGKLIFPAGQWLLPTQHKQELSPRCCFRPGTG